MQEREQVKNEVSKDNTCHSSGSSNSNLQHFSGSIINELERTTERTACMDGVARRRADNFIRWCYHCKHEVPGYLETDVCELCGNEIVKKIINNTKEEV